MYTSIGFIGTGAMGSSLARAASEGAQGSPIYLANRTPKRAQILAQEICATATDNASIAKTCNLIFLGVKPQMMERTLKPLIPILKERTDRFVLASMAAGLNAEHIQTLAGGEYPVICLMPNTPIDVGAGIIQYYGVNTTEQELDDFQTLLASTGLVDRVNPDYLDAASAVSACGPAFCALFVDAIADAGVACGLSREKSLLYAAQMVSGTAQLILNGKRHPGQLKDSVCSPSGTTIQGVRTLERLGFRSAAMEAVITAYEKTVEMAKK